MNHVLLTPMDTVRNIFATNVFGTFESPNSSTHDSRAKAPR